ncbi:MAG: hypothetical protein H7222_03355 [Methylotenera sp.]|nr:hypothetical protein [Oligoflexia bacterium]
MTAFVDAHHNTFVSTCNAAMNNSSSHDVNFHDNRMVTSSFLPDGTRVDNSPGACTGCVNNTFLPSPITSATEKNEWILWPQKVAGNGIWVGTTGSFNNDTQAAPLGINPFWPALPSGSMNPAPTLNVLSGGTWRKVHRRAGSFRRQEVDGL